jgi:platelet-activating factor acetylhydrolase IB subunit alpha
MVISSSRDREIRAWNIPQASCLFVLSGHDNWVNGLALHMDGIHLYSVSDDKSLRVSNENIC